MNTIPPIVAVLVVIGLAWLLRRMLGRRFKGMGWPGAPKNREIEPLGRLTLTAHHSVHDLRWGDQRLLLVLHPGGCTVVDRFRSEDERERSLEIAKGPMKCSASAV